MKKLIIIFMICFSSFIKAQSIENATITPQPKNYESYLNKQKKQKKTGWILLTGGAVMGASGLIIQTATEATKLISLIALQPDLEENNQTGNYIASAGLVAMATSIPFFIASGKNKNRAKIALQQEKITMGHKINQQANYNSIAIRISLAK